MGPESIFAASLFLVQAFSSLVEASRSSRAISGVILVQAESPGSLMLEYSEPWKSSNLMTLGTSAVSGT